jgi:hypothetical protein
VCSFRMASYLLRSQLTSRPGLYHPRYMPRHPRPVRRQTIPVTNTFDQGEPHPPDPLFPVHPSSLRVPQLSFPKSDPFLSSRSLGLSDMHIVRFRHAFLRIQEQDASQLSTMTTTAPWLLNTPTRVSFQLCFLLFLMTSYLTCMVGAVIELSFKCASMAACYTLMDAPRPLEKEVAPAIRKCGPKP